ncbi:hypothetical protein LIS82_07765 [Cytobacillus solani]|uniref:hypothetical protein n=1 Tax=Cytobacillus solani TaxID=1637975 RepID=UPI00207A8998|nr:hypothetical protein [Cytobacillus solani]USK56358.1 hypothetical protein LIS82_07765 [Cytobacillus solani]
MEAKNIENDGVLKKNALKTAFYIYDAIQSEDYESANLEMIELKLLIKRLEDKKAKRERLQILSDVVKEMKARGIKIDFAIRASFLKNDAKNAVEKYHNTAFFREIDKKRQQA